MSLIFSRHFNPETQPELTPPPSHQRWGNHSFYSKFAIERALDVLGDDNTDALAVTGNEDAARFTSKIVLPHYCVLKPCIGTIRTARLNAVNTVTGKLRLLSVHDFVLDVELCAKRALKRRPALLKSFVILFEREHGERVNEYARRAPRAFDLLLAVLGAELGRRGIAGVSSYLHRPSKKRGAR